MTPGRKAGRKPKAARVVVNIVERKDGRRQHLYSLTLDVHPSEVHKLLHQHFGAKIIR